MKKILVPCDFSGPAQEAFKFGVRIVKQSKGEIHVLHILDITFLRGNPTLSHSYAFNLNFLKDMEKEAEAKFKTMWEKYSPLTLPVKFKHSIGSLIPDIESYVRENEIDLIVMGTQWGSNTEKILKHAPVPTFAIQKEPGTQIKKIVVPITQTQLDRSFCEQVKQLQLFFNASLHLLWINTPEVFKNDADAEADLTNFARKANFSDYSINIRSDYSIEKAIYRFAHDTHADMVAMETRAVNGLIRFLTGSIPGEIVNNVNLPIWTYTTR